MPAALLADGGAREGDTRLGCRSGAPPLREGLPRGDGGYEPLGVAAISPLGLLGPQLRPWRVKRAAVAPCRGCAGRQVCMDRAREIRLPLVRGARAARRYAPNPLRRRAGTSSRHGRARGGRGGGGGGRLSRTSSSSSRGFPPCPREAGIGGAAAVAARDGTGMAPCYREAAVQRQHASTKTR